MVWQNIVILCVRDVAAAVVPSLRLSQDVNCCKVFFWKELVHSKPKPATRALVGGGRR